MSLRRRSLTPRVEALEVRTPPAAFLPPPPGNPPIVHPQPQPIGPAGPGVTYTAAVPYAPTNPW